MTAPAPRRSRRKASSACPAAVLKKPSTIGAQPGASESVSGAQVRNRGGPSASSGRLACFMASGAEQRLERLAGLLGAHERLAHQEGMHAGAAHALHVHE